jgi:hypothetical protein
LDAAGLYAQLSGNSHVICFCDQMGGRKKHREDNLIIDKRGANALLNRSICFLLLSHCAFFLAFPKLTYVAQDSQIANMTLSYQSGLHLLFKSRDCTEFNFNNWNFESPLEKTKFSSVSDRKRQNETEDSTQSTSSFKPSVPFPLFPNTRESLR